MAVSDDGYVMLLAESRFRTSRASGVLDGLRLRQGYGVTGPPEHDRKDNP